MVTAAQGNGQRAEPMPVRGWLIVGAIVAMLIIAALAVIYGPPGLSTSAGECTEVTSASCRPFLDALYDTLGGPADEIASIRGRPWCGDDACQVLFGSSALRLRVTFNSGESIEYVCFAGAFESPSCELRDTP